MLWRSALVAASSFALVVAGCAGSSGHRAAAKPRPRIPAEVAQQLAADADAVASTPGCAAREAAVKLQQAQKDAIPSVLPIGLGAQSGAYAKVFTDTFTRMVMNKEDPMTVLKDEGNQLQQLLTAAGAACWQPDAKSTGVCQVGG